MTLHVGGRGADYLGDLFSGEASWSVCHAGNVSGQTRTAQPLHALQLEDALLKIETVIQATGLSAATIYRKVAAGELTIVKLGKRCSRFRAADVRAWIQAQGASQ